VNDVKVVDERDLAACMQQPPTVKPQTTNSAWNAKVVGPRSIVAVERRKGAVELRSALGLLPVLTTPARTKQGGNRKSRRHPKK
jgi:hypothetical protein